MSRPRSGALDLFFSAVVLGTAGLVGCSDVVQPPSDPLVQRVVAMGFREDMIVDAGTYFRVEGDIVFMKQSLREPHDPAPALPLGLRPSFQWRTTNTVSQPAVGNVRVVIASGVEAGWAQATRDAIVEWNGIFGTVIHIVESGPADITVSMNPSLPGTTVAQATFPVGSPSFKPGPTIQINPAFNGLSAEQKLHNMAHEFGHTIGLRHSNWQARGETVNPGGAILVPGTPQTDGGSVMNGGTPFNQFAGFSTWDIEAARVMYPFILVVTVTDQGVGNPYIVTWTAAPGAVEYQISTCWTVTDEFEGQFYQYQACGPMPPVSQPTTTFPNTGEPFCQPYFQIRAVFANRPAPYWTAPIFINAMNESDC